MEGQVAPDDTEIISNVVTSPHDLSAEMVTSRIHRVLAEGVVTAHFYRSWLYAAPHGPAVSVTVVTSR